VTLAALTLVDNVQLQVKEKRFVPGVIRSKEDTQAQKAEYLSTQFTSLVRFLIPRTPLGLLVTRAVAR
jgi:hypothetical protein